MIIDTTITLGNILTLLVVAGSFAAFLFQFRSDLRVLITRMDQFDRDLNEMKAQTSKLGQLVERIGEVLVELAKQQTRMDGMDRRIDEGNEERNKAYVNLDRRLDDLITSRTAIIRDLEERIREVETGRNNALRNAKR